MGRGADLRGGQGRGDDSSAAWSCRVPPDRRTRRCWFICLPISGRDARSCGRCWQARSRELQLDLDRWGYLDQRHGAAAGERSERCSTETRVAEAFESALKLVCGSLAHQIVDDGEGVTHVVTLMRPGLRPRRMRSRSRSRSRTRRCARRPGRAATRTGAGCWRPRDKRRPRSTRTASALDRRRVLFLSTACGRWTSMKLRRTR